MAEEELIIKIKTDSEEVKKAVSNENDVALEEAFSDAVGGDLPTSNNNNFMDEAKYHAMFSQLGGVVSNPKGAITGMLPQLIMNHLPKIFDIYIR